MKINKQNLGWIIALILLLVILAYFVMMFYDSQIEKGVEEGILIGQEQVILKINQEATIPIISQEENGNYVDWVSIQEVCGNVG